MSSFRKRTSREENIGTTEPCLRTLELRKSNLPRLLILQSPFLSTTLEETRLPRGSNMVILKALYFQKRFLKGGSFYLLVQDITPKIELEITHWLNFLQFHKKQQNFIQHGYISPYIYGFPKIHKHSFPLIIKVDLRGFSTYFMLLKHRQSFAK